MARNLQVESPASTATLSTAAVSAQKCRMVADLVRGHMLEEAHRRLILDRKKSAKLILNLIKSAMANAQQKGLADLDRLYVSEIQIGEGPRIRRFMPRAQGRADRRLKRTSHIYLALSEKRVASNKGKKKAAKAKSGDK
jgi:large subunit ribosomal protein L22